MVSVLVWCGVVWCGVVFLGLVWCNESWCWYGTVKCGMSVWTLKICYVGC